MNETATPGSFLWHRDQRFLLFNVKGDQTSSRGLLLFASVFLGSLAVAAILLPLVYAVIGWWYSGSAPQFLLTGKGAYGVFDLLRWLPILVGLPWLMSVCRLWSLEALGLGEGAGIARRLWMLGFAAGALLVAVLAAGQLLSGAVLFSPRVGFSPLQILKFIAGVSATALVVSVIEEIIFRGLILRIFYTTTRTPWLALALSAAFFAYTHFKISDNAFANIEPAQWTTGWLAAYWTLIDIVVDFDFNRFAALWLLGMALGALALRSGSLWPAIGLHAGLVFGALLYHGLIRNLVPSGGFWGTKPLIDGLAASVFLVPIFLVVAFAKLPAFGIRTVPDQASPSPNRLPVGVAARAPAFGGRNLES